MPRTGIAGRDRSQGSQGAGTERLEEEGEEKALRKTGPITLVRHNDLVVNEKFIDVLQNNNLDDLLSLSNYGGGTVLKKNVFRSVSKIELSEGDVSRTFYLKKHNPPRRERFKSLLLRRREDAENEWKNLLLLHDLGFGTATPVAYGEKKKFGITSFSVTVTEHLYGAEKLESYLPRRFTPPLGPGGISEKRVLINKIAALTREFHAMGFNHQDYYLGHLFFREEDGRILILDLQRMKRRAAIRNRDRIKDLGQLCYSAGLTGVFTNPDFIRFVLAYLGREMLEENDKRLIRRVMAKKARIARHDRKLLMRKALPQ
jgi:hypothetical protein